MAEASRLCHWLEAYVGSGASPTQQAESLDAIVSLLKKEALTMEQLVVGMEKYLTSMDHVIRGRGILLLAVSLARLESKSLGSAAIHSLVAFFSDRLFGNTTDPNPGRERMSGSAQDVFEILNEKTVIALCF
uniref:MMS19 nucleotide excision repair protein n=1 Tax=Kalanchoe fedtschenkoi TaxID=63787 RepID=A0A7N0SX31_KALFE